MPKGDATSEIPTEKQNRHRKAKMMLIRKTNFTDFKEGYFLSFFPKYLKPVQARGSLCINHTHVHLRRTLSSKQMMPVLLPLLRQMWLFVNNQEMFESSYYSSNNSKLGSECVPGTVGTIKITAQSLTSRNLTSSRKSQTQYYANSKGKIKRKIPGCAWMASC